MIKFELSWSSGNVITRIDDCCHGYKINIATKITLTKSIYHWYLTMHIGRKLTVLWHEGELGSSVRLLTCFCCCCCCPSQCALPTQCPIGHLVYLQFYCKMQLFYPIDLAFKLNFRKLNKGNFFLSVEKKYSYSLFLMLGAVEEWQSVSTPAFTKTIIIQWILLLTWQ